ncbi:amidohydrolase family protein [Fulvivirgaceae bacterium BMA10]|uniref:Amidohydrolase family protein n=1 Tax=Splendidivirga corallicola TaxID=3051826 RepID=A0ABT8KRT3_9BACT|nr:amidohydrolase family protein [Fulvivirgaceae bacterium BMA10]
MKLALKSLTFVYLIGISISLLCCNGSNQQNNTEESSEADHAITNTNVISMKGEEIQNNQTVLIKEGKIVKIGDADKVKVPEGTTEIDGNGKYLMPGLAEMHAHIPGNQNGEEIVEETLFLYLSNGITTIRGMLGQPYHLELKEKVNKGEMLGPRIYTSGPSLNGNTVPDTAIARKMVTEQKEAGYDFLKLHPGIKLDVFNEIVETANEVGITFAGHVSTDVGIRRAIEAKYASIDHVDGYLEGLVPESAGVDPGANGFFGINFTNLADESMIPELAKATKEANVWVVSTQCLMERWAGPGDPEALGAEEEMQYMSPQVISSWVNRKKNFIADENYSVETANKFNEIRRRIIKALHDEGVGLILGSDAPQIFNVPGFSIHHELKSMIDSGLTPYETLKTGTANPAIYFDAEGSFGTVEEGASADLILLNSNPLESIENVKNKAGVMVRGKWLSEKEIQENLKQIAYKHANSEGK